MSEATERLAPTAVERLGDTPRDTPTRGPQRWPFWSAVVVLVVGLVATGLLTLVSSNLYTHNERRLLKLRARDVGAVLTSALPSIQTPLASGAALADATHGDPTRFKRLVASYIGKGGSQPFRSISLWRAPDARRGPLAVVGTTPVLTPQSPQTVAFLKRASTSSKLTVIGLLQGMQPRLGYAFTGMAGGPFVAYGESALPPDRYSPAQKNSAFNDIDFALYLGAAGRPADLLIASVRRLPLNGRAATVKVPFGNTYFTITVAAKGPLGGSLPQRLPWAIAILGVLLTLGVGALTLRLIERRRSAERLAGRLEVVADENRRLYAEQRGIAQTLQHALLPEKLPQLPGMQVGARYEAGAEGVEIGGDWYDLVVLDDRRLLLVVGDVSGRGLRAAATMASLRFAIHAYVAEGDEPPVILSKLSRLVSVSGDGQLATVLCALVDVRAREVSITSAGHLPPLLISGGGSEFVEGPVGLPVGVDRDASYSSTTILAPAGATLLAFTDGLVERRGENIDAGLERLRSQVSLDYVTLDQLLSHVLDGLRDDAVDDTAIAGVRWMT